MDFRGKIFVPARIHGDDACIEAYVEIGEYWKKNARNDRGRMVDNVERLEFLAFHDTIECVKPELGQAFLDQRSVWTIVDAAKRAVDYLSDGNIRSPKPVECDTCDGTGSVSAYADRDADCPDCHDNSGITVN